METLTHLTQLLTQPPGNLAYHLIVLFAIGGALQAAWAQWQHAPYPQTRRLMQGLAVLLAARLAMFALGGLAWQEMVSAHMVLPIADRAAMALTIALFTWLWGFPERHRTGDRLLGGTLALIALAVVASAIFWPDYAQRYFNNSLIDWAWSGFAILLGVLGLLILLQRRPDNAGAGIVALGVLTLGHVVHVLVPMSSGDLDSYLRFADLVAYPLVFTLPYRFSTMPKAPPPPRPIQVQQAAAPPPATEIPKALWALLGTRPNAPEACPRLAKAVALWLKADLCLVVTPPHKGRVSIACAYDLIREKALGGTTLNADHVPILTTAMARRRSLRLPASSTSTDVRTLAQALNLNRTGPILAAPLDAGGEFPLQGGLVLLSTYAQHSWTGEEQKQLAAVGRKLGRWLAWGNAQPSEAPQPAEDCAPAATVEALQSENAALRRQVEEADAMQERLTAVIAAYEEARQLVAQLEEENRRLLSAQAALEARLAVQEAEQHAREEHPEHPEGADAPAEADAALLAEAREALEEARREIEQLKASMLRAREEAENHTQNLKMLLSIAQDLRQPLAALSGYADLLLGESVGILGALQRQFVERIRANAARLGHAVDDIVRLLAIDANDVVLHFQQVHLNEIIDQAITRNSDLLREKRLLLRVDLPDTLPAVQLDKEMLQQIVHHLLRNAALASPEEGEIHLRLQLNEEDGERLLWLQIRDSGSGIAAEDIPRVFSRRYRTAYRTIDGLGDNGLGMPLVKALVDALEGRIWIDSQRGQGTTFTVLLPLLDATPIPPAREEEA